MDNTEPLPEYAKVPALQLIVGSQRQQDKTMTQNVDPPGLGVDKWSIAHEYVNCYQFNFH